MLNRMKKISCLLLTTSLVATGCSGATSSTEKAEKQTTNGTVSLRICGAEEDQELLNQIVSTFKDEYSSEASFEITVEALSESECKDKILGDVLNAPDVFTFADDQLSTLVASGVLKAVENAEEIKARNSESSVAAATIDETLYAYPLTADNGYFLFYNKSVFKESDLATFDGMLKVASSKGKKVTMDLTSGWYLYAFFGNTGLNVGLNEDGISNFCDWNATDGSVKGTDVVKALTDITSSNAFICGGDDALLAGAKKGTVAAGVSGVWSSTVLKETWGQNYGAVKLPTFTCAGKQVQLASYVGYKMVGVNSYSPNRSWAEKLADWISNETNQNLRFEQRDQGPANSNSAKSDAVAASPAIQALIAQSEFSSLQRIGANYWGPAGELGKAVTNHSFGGLTTQEFLDKIVKEITASNAQ